MIYELGPHRVATDGDAFFVAPSAAVIGRVTLGRDANVWFGAVLRGRGSAFANSYFFRPACFKTLFRVPAGTSVPALPAMVTAPGFRGCRNCR
jgi:hypothetical protein